MAPDNDSHRLKDAEPAQQPADAPRDDNDDPVLPNDEPTTDKRHTVSESADKITLKTKLKRGTGTRDEDKFDAKVKGDDPDEVAERMADLMDALDEHDLVQTARDTRGN